MGFPFRKYHNKPVYIDGVKFDSKGEGDRFLFLQGELQAGRIKNLRRQVPFQILPAHWSTRQGAKGKPVRDKLALSAISYKADFVYETPDGVTVYEDYKGMETPEFRIKEALLYDRFGIRLSKPKRPTAPVGEHYLTFD